MSSVAYLPDAGYAMDTASVAAYYMPCAGWVPTGVMNMPIAVDRPQPVPTPWIVNGQAVRRGLPVGFYAPCVGWVKEFVPPGL